MYGGDLYHETKNKQLTQNESLVVIKDIILGLNFLKKNKVVHADLKPENILFYNNLSLHVVICDFGISMDISKVNMNYNIQSMWYRAPEIIFHFKYDYSIDVWSMGCIIFEIIYGKALFTGKTNEVLFKNIVSFLGVPSDKFQNTNKTIREYFTLNNTPIIKCKPDDILSMDKKISFINSYNNKNIVDIIYGSLTWSVKNRYNIEKCLSKISELI
jgi:serine/threonine-protein kinase PRP4